MKRVYIISRYRAAEESEMEFNRLVARHFARGIIKDGDVPVAPHLFYTQFLNERILSERECGLGFGLYDLQRSDKFLLVIVDGIISVGMMGEIAEATRLGLQGRIVLTSRQRITEELDKFEAEMKRTE